MEGCTQNVQNNKPAQTHKLAQTDTNPLHMIQITRICWIVCVCVCACVCHIKCACMSLFNCVHQGMRTSLLNISEDQERKQSRSWIRECGSLLPPELERQQGAPSPGNNKKTKNCLIFLHIFQFFLAFSPIRFSATYCRSTW